MKRILMRAGMSPLSSVPAWKVLTNNNIGNNLGNLLFPYSLFRTLTLEDVQIDTQKTEKKFSRKDIARFNQEYDCLILPYANAFRRSFKDSLKVVTRLVWQLHIPCIVTGVGFQRGTKDTWKDPELDRIVKAFMKAVLHKSALVGVRGEGTAEYLKGLGFVPEKHFTVIGCPSMFMHGEQLPEWKKMGTLDEHSKISFNSKIQLPQKFHDFIYREMQKYPEYHYVPQVREEMMMMYAGVPYPKKFCKKRPENFPALASDELYRSGHGISFVNVPTWLK